MLKLLVDHAQPAQVVQLHHRADTVERDAVCHHSALRACSKLKLADKASAIQARSRIGASSDSACDIRATTNLISFHGERGEVEQALAAFWSVRETEKRGAVRSHSDCAGCK